MSEQEKVASVTSEESAPLRTQLAINQEYTQCATQLGDVSCKIDQMYKTTTEIRKRMGELCLEKAAPEAAPSPEAQSQ